MEPLLELKDLSVKYFTSDGTVEAVIHQSLPVWGVQWHPERMDDTALFRAFFALCGEKER